MKAPLLLAVLLVCSVVARAETPEEKGLAIIKDAEKRGENFGDLRAEAEMVIRNGRGGEAKRALKIALLDLPGSASKSLTVVDAPKDVKGTALLTHTAADASDQQWLYLPAAARTKRIASSGRSGPFMGSEFSFDDFSAQTVERYRFKWLRTEACPAPLAAEKCDVIERIPKESGSGYARQEVWMDQSQRRLQKADYFDAQNQRIKTLVAEGYKQYEGKFWRATTLTMTNARSGASTVLSWSNIRFKSGLTEADFDTSRLASAR